MKKIISLSAVLILLLQVFVCPADAKTYDSESAKNLLVGLGIMGKYDFEDDEEISRADFAGLAVRTMNKLEEASGVVGDKFGDVSMEDDHAAEIYYLDSLDVMIGDDSGNFNPYEPLLMKDAVKAVVTMLNYGAQAKSSGGYPLGYMNVASEIGLTKGMNKNRDAVLTAKEAVILLANALNTEMLQQVFEGGKISFKTIEGETLLYKAFDCIKGEGRVSANDKTTLEIPKRSSEGTVVIDDFTFDRGTTDIDEKLGYYVEYYAFEPEGTGDWVIAAYEILENKNEILELAAVDITEETTENEIVYEYGSRVKSAKIAPAADVIYNGFAIQGAEKWQLMPDSGNVTLFDTDSDNTYDIVIIESYINYVLDKAVQGDYIIDKYSQPAIDLDEDNWEEISARLSGKEIDLSELKEWDVLSVKVDAEKLDANGYREIDFDKAQYIEISVSRKEISGRADSVDRAEGIITIGFDEYRISQNLLKAELDAQNGFKLPDGGEALSVVLDINGNAAAIKTSGFTQMQYGFLVKTIVDTEDEPVAVYLKIYTGEQGIVTFKCKEKFRFNGENGLNTVWADELINKPQLVSFRTNTEGLICDIDTGVLNTS